jgi:hypothetical protein
MAKCKSPDCGSAAAARSRFCAEHTELFARVRGELKSAATAKRTIKGLTIRHVEPTAPQTRRVAEHYKERILEALEDGSLTGRELSKAAGVASKDRTFARARLSLQEAGEIEQIDTGKAAKRYALAEPPKAAA